MGTPVSIYSSRMEQGDSLTEKLMKIWYWVAVSGGGITPGEPGGPTGSSNLPYGADEQVLTNVVGGPGPTVIVYKKAGVTVKTRILTYTGSGPTDVLTHTVDT